MANDAMYSVLSSILYNLMKYICYLFKITITVCGVNRLMSRLYTSFIIYPYMYNVRHFIKYLNIFSNYYLYHVEINANLHYFDFPKYSSF